MSFISAEYALLFLTVFCVYYACPRHQLLILLVASLFFYGWEEPFALPLLLVTSVVSSAITYLILRDPLSDLEASTYYRRGFNFLREIDPHFGRRYLRIDWSRDIR